MSTSLVPYTLKFRCWFSRGKNPSLSFHHVINTHFYGLIWCVPFYSSTLDGLYISLTTYSIFFFFLISYWHFLITTSRRIPALLSFPSLYNSTHLSPVAIRHTRQPAAWVIAGRKITSTLAPFKIQELLIKSWNAWWLFDASAQPIILEHAKRARLAVFTVSSAKLGGKKKEKTKRV